MKNIYTLLLCLFAAASSFAANLTASSFSASFGKKDGKINLVITGGFAPYSISWTGPGGYASSKMNPDSLAAGTYCVTVTDNYCGVATMCVTVSQFANGINEIATANWEVFPNPFKNQISINFGKEVHGDVNLSLYDISGKIVAQQILPANQQRLDWNLAVPLPEGTYIIHIDTKDGTHAQRQLISTGNGK